QLAEFVVAELVGLEPFDRSVELFLEKQQVEDAHHAAVDQRGELRRHLAREVRLIGREFDHYVIDGPELVEVTVGHVCCLSFVVLDFDSCRRATARSGPATLTRSPPRWWARSP